MKTVMIAASAAAMALTGACTEYGYGRPGYASSGYWDASRYYRSGDRYGDRTLGRDDSVYVGSDGRYYCKRSDGTTGLIIGGIAGGVLGNIIAPGGSKTLGTIIGAAGGAAIGASVDKGDVRCR
ncbi:glycine zipper 2TM domain-containing protein [Sphingomonas sp.]|uniref:glycine zipper 2TM domain-containing protein n=1 Tax=Sphingomonas sp. TaxID=28214 RepID=UPI001ECD2846|nr:glycine zipper 2TM domain-containing protein [Sphingomonas sp.]MBX3593250.1 glycine zipper 2TM domain-containing protein [Sphingomonas sp.]